MKLIDVIPIGKKNRETRDNLMYKAKIMNIQEFRKELAKLKEQYIIAFDDGYYVPASKEEYIEFINKLKEKINDANKTMSLAYKEMEELEYVRSIHNNIKER